MKKQIVGFINFCLLTFFKMQFFLKLFFISKSKTLVFIDIDNTIANTWPTIKSTAFTSEKDRHKKLVAFDGMKKYINNNYKNNTNNYIIFYLTARYFNLINITKNWLKENNFLSHKDNMIVVDKPLNKIFFLKYSVLKKYKTIYIDDLSFNHENGEVKFYSSVIDEVKKMNVSYMGYSEINKINNDL